MKDKLPVVSSKAHVPFPGYGMHAVIGQVCCCQPKQLSVHGHHHGKLDMLQGKISDLGGDENILEVGSLEQIILHWYTLKESATTSC